MSQVHDNVILSYTVDLENQKIVLHTKYSNRAFNEQTTVEFINVIAHSFQNEVKSSTIFEIDSLSLEDFIKDNNDSLMKQKDYGWPMMYTTEKELLNELQKAKQSYFTIDSSIGLCGWVLAEKMNITVMEV